MQAGQLNRAPVASCSCLTRAMDAACLILALSCLALPRLSLACSVVERVLLVHGQQLHQHSTELARLSRALAAQLSHGRCMSQQAQRVQHGDAEMAEASRKRVRSSEQHNLQQNEEPPPSPTVLPIPLQQEHPGRQQEPQGGAASLQAEPRWQRGQQEEQLARLTSTLRYLHISRELAQQTQAMRSCSSVEILASGRAAYMQPTALKQSLGRAAAAIAARHGGLQPSSPLQLDAAVLPCIVRAVLTEHCQTAAAVRRGAAAQRPVDFWLTAEQLCRRVCERSKAALPSLLLLHEQPFQEQAAIRKKVGLSKAWLRRAWQWCRVKGLTVAEGCLPRLLCMHVSSTAARQAELALASPFQYRSLAWSATCPSSQRLQWSGRSAGTRSFSGWCCPELAGRGRRQVTRVHRRDMLARLQAERMPGRHPPSTTSMHVCTSVVLHV